MDWDFYQDLAKHWKRFPPVHMSVSHFLGISKPEEEPETWEDSVADIAAMLGQSSYG